MIRLLTTLAFVAAAKACDQPTANVQIEQFIKCMKGQLPVIKSGATKLQRKECFTTNNCGDPVCIETIVKAYIDQCTGLYSSEWEEILPYIFSIKDKKMRKVFRTICNSNEGLTKAMRCVTTKGGAHQVTKPTAWHFGICIFGKNVMCAKTMKDTLCTCGTAKEPAMANDLHKYCALSKKKADLVSKRLVKEVCKPRNIMGLQL